MKILISGAGRGLIRAFRAGGHRLKVINTARTVLPVPYTGYIWSGTEKVVISDYDLCVILSYGKLSIMFYNYLKGTGIKLIGDPLVRARFDSKFWGPLIASQHGVPVIPFIYGNGITGEMVSEVSGDEGKVVEKHTNLANGMRVSLLDSDKVSPRDGKLYQKFIDCGAQDERWICVGDKIICAMRRIAVKEGEFRANISQGGRGEKLSITPEMEELAMSITKHFPGYIYTGLDILTDPKTGTKYFLESNPLPGTHIINVCRHDFYKDIYNYIMKEYNAL